MNQLSSIFEDLAKREKPNCSVVVTVERSFLFIVNSDGSTMIVDSHYHHRYGALIGHAQPGEAGSMAHWLTKMIFHTWKLSVKTVSVTTVIYVNV